MGVGATAFPNFIKDMDDMQPVNLNTNIDPKKLSNWFKKISLPAYDQCLKASHVFNILDARGAISVAQRAGYIARIRDITKSAAGIWLDSQK